MQSYSVPFVYRADYSKELIGHVTLMSLNRQRHHVVYMAAYSLNDLGLR